MKLQSKFTEIAVFLASFFILLLPPILANPSGENRFTTWNFPLQNLILAATAVLLLLINKSLHNKETQQNNVTNFCDNAKSKTLILLINGGTMFFTFGMLLIYGILLQLFASFVLNLPPLSNTKVLLPSGITQIFFCILMFACAAFYEEAIYRKYIQESLEWLISKEDKKIVLAIELISALLFSLSHRYNGQIAVVNAFGAHFILRHCALKTNGIAAGTIAHFLYNIATLFVLSA